jgi:succinyl-CoA synthetase alpha subunit
LDGKVPVFDSVKKAVEYTGANCSVLFVPSRFAADAMYEAAGAGIPIIVCITEGIPVQDIIRAKAYTDAQGCRLIGPNSPGLLTPGEAKVGIIPGQIALPGNIGILSRSGTLTYEVLYALKRAEMGASTCIGIGGDEINGTSFCDALKLYEADPGTEKILLIGEIGGSEEEKAADLISSYLTKPVIAFIAGQSAPSGKRMGHAGAIIERGSGSAEDKVRAFQSIGVRVARHPEEIPDMLLS